MKIKRDLVQIFLLGVMLLPVSVRAQFQWAERIASVTNWPEGEPNTGLALDPNDNCYVTGYFYGTNNFGGVTLTNQSIGGSDIFVAKYNATGALQWVQRAGGTSTNYGRGIGVDINGNIYATGGYSGSANFGGINLPAPSGEEFFLAKYNNAGAVQWVQPATGGSDDVYGIGLTVDGAGNSYALVVVDDLSGDATSITFGSTIVPIPADNGTPVAILVKFDNTGTVQWAQLMGGSDEVYATKVAVDAAGNVYVRGTFYSTLTIGASTLTISDGSSKNMFIAKFNSSGALIWVQQPQGGNAGEGGVAVDQAGDVYVSGYFDTDLDFGGGITLASAANGNALFGDAFLAKYDSSGAIQWAQSAGGTNGGFYWDLALDAQTNIYAAGFLGSDTAVAKYSSAGTLQWTASASGRPASPVSSGASKCAVDATGNCYLTGFYQGTNTFGTNTLQPQEAWNFFLAELPSNTVANPAIQFTASPTSGTPPLSVQFNSPNVDSLGNAITSWNWNFGDGSISTLQNPPHIYTASGTFTPTLIATNNNGVTVIGYGPQITILTPTASANFTFITNNNAITITGYIGSGGDVLIPSAINELPVSDIGYEAFDSSSVTSVTIPNTVTNIGLSAFAYCTSLTNITVIAGNPDYSSTNGVLFNQNQTTLIAFPGGLGGSYTIPNSVTTIGEEAFAYCTSLNSVTIPNGVTNIGDAAFAYCNDLTSITVIAGNSDYSSTHGVLFNQNQTMLIQFPEGVGGSYTIPNSVTSIGDAAFADCYDLTSVTIPNSVTSIGEDEFSGCYNLTSVIIPNSVTSIGEDEFADCIDLTSVTIPNSVTNIGDAAFADCYDLTSVIIPNNVTSIGEDEFADCRSLTSVTIGNSVTSIGEYAFYDCGIYSVTIPNSVASIGEGAFGDCTSLANITFLGNAPVLADANEYTDDDVAANAVYYYYGTSGWSLTYGGLPAVELNPSSPFTYTTNSGAITITGYSGTGGAVTIPASINGYPVTSIGAYAFNDWTSITNVIIPNSITSIGEYAFYYCTGLNSFTIPNSVTSIGEAAFYVCTSLTNIIFLGNAPVLANAAEFTDDVVAANAIYYYYGNSGWGATYGGLPTVGLFMPPQISGIGSNVGAPSGNFSFTVTGVSNQTIVVEASTNLVKWQPVWTNTLSGTNAIFTDPQWKNYPSRFYRAQ